MMTPKDLSILGHVIEEAERNPKLGAGEMITDLYSTAVVGE